MPSRCDRFCRSWQGFSSSSKVAFMITEPLSHCGDMSRGNCRICRVKVKSVEPMALKAGVPPRSLQESLTHLKWDAGTLRDQVQRIVATEHLSHGTRVGLVDETTFAKKGTKTPGIQRQWCGHLGKVENCVTTVHLGVASGPFQSLIDGDLFLPESWDEDRDRCGELKCFLADAPGGLAQTPTECLLWVAPTRHRVERLFQDDKTELGLDHFEGRQYQGFMRHLMLTLVSHLFLMRATLLRRGETSGVDIAPSASRVGPATPRQVA